MYGKKNDIKNNGNWLLMRLRKDKNEDKIRGWGRSGGHGIVILYVCRLMMGLYDGYIEE